MFAYYCTTINPLSIVTFCTVTKIANVSNFFILFNWEQLLNRPTNIATYRSAKAMKDASFLTVFNHQWFIITWSYQYKTILLSYVLLSYNISNYYLSDISIFRASVAAKILSCIGIFYYFTFGTVVREGFKKKSQTWDIVPTGGEGVRLLEFSAPTSLSVLLSSISNFT